MSEITNPVQATPYGIAVAGLLEVEDLCDQGLQVDMSDIRAAAARAREAASRVNADHIAAALLRQPADAEPEPAKVIVVTEAPVGDRMPVERRYAANSWDVTYEPDHGETLDVGTRDRSRPLPVNGGSDLEVAATYAPHAWLSVREDGADADDKTGLALSIACKALDALWTEINRKGGCNPVMLTGLAENAIADLADLGYES